MGREYPPTNYQDNLLTIIPIGFMPIFYFSINKVTELSDVLKLTNVSIKQKVLKSFYTGAVY